MNNFQKHMKAFFDSGKPKRDCSTCLHGERVKDRTRNGYFCRIARIVECINQGATYDFWELKFNEEFLTVEEMAI